MRDLKKGASRPAGSPPVKKVSPDAKRLATSSFDESSPTRKPGHGREAQKVSLPARVTKGIAKVKKSGPRRIGAKTALKCILTPLRHTEALEAVRFGLLPQQLDILVERGYARAKLIKLIGPRGTIERKLNGSIRLDLQESDRLARLNRIIASAEAVFGNSEQARHWMERPSSKLPLGESPLSLLDTDGGTQVVTERLLQIKYGIFA